MGKYKLTPKDLSEIAGVPHVYSRGDVAQAFSDGFHYRPALTDEQLDQAIDFLNTNGHNEANFNHIVNSFASPSYTYNGYNPIKIQAQRFPRQLFNAGKFVLNTLDIPRRTIASMINNKDNASDDRYSPAHIFDVQDYRATPVAGTKFAQDHPAMSLAADMLTGLGATAAISGVSNIMSNAGNQALLSQTVTGPQKSILLNQIANKTVSPNVGYSVSKRLVPKISVKSSSSFNSVRTPGKVAQQTGKAGSNGRRFGWDVKSGPIDRYTINSSYEQIPGMKVQTDVTAWPVVPFGRFIWPGMPQFVPQIQPVVVPQNIPETILEDQPVEYTTSDIINWAIKNRGFQEGDTIEGIPGSGPIRYIRGNGGLGNRYKVGVHREYDAHPSDVKQQPNIPYQTIITNGSQSGVRKIKGRNPNWMQRDYNNYFPYIVP